MVKVAYWVVTIAFAALFLPLIFCKPTEEII